MGLQVDWISKKKVKFRYKIVDDKGKVQEIQVDAFYIPLLGCRLSSPQAYFWQMYKDSTDTNGSCEMTVKHDKSTLELVNSSKTLIY
jgi:hypothetical protein